MVIKSMYETLYFKYQNTPITIVALKPLEEFTIQNRTYGPVEPNREFDVPRWVANVLLSNESVRLKSPTVDLPDLQKALWRETGEPVLQPLSPNFYFHVKHRLNQLNQENKREPNDVRLAAFKKMEQLIRDLVSNRLLKLMKISLREQRLRETKKRMTEEERWLIDRLVNLLRNWQRHVLEVEPNV